MSFSKLCPEMVHDLFHYHKISLETQKGYSIERKALRDSWSSHKLSFKVFFEAHRLQKLCSSSLYLEGAFVDTKNVTLPLQHQKLHGAASYYKQAKPLQASDLVRIKQNCKILQNSQKKGTHEVSGHFDTIWPKFNPPTAEQELSAATVLKISNLQSEPVDGLKIPPKGSTSNFKSNRRRLTIHQFLNNEIKPLGGENPRCCHSSNQAHR